LKTLIAMFVLALSCSSSALGSAGNDERLRATLRADLTQYLQARAKAEHISAASLSISLRGMPETINVTAGTTRYGGAGARVVPANIFQIGSNTKAFTSVTLLQLEAEGKLTIYQTVGRWLPQYPAWKDVTIQRLLNMTSGIPSYDNVPSMMRAYARAPYRNWSAEQLVATVYPRPGHVVPPTTGWSYSNTNYILGQMIIERATGNSYGEELRRRFFSDPLLQLNSTFYATDQYPPPVRERIVSGYFFNTDPDNASLAPLVGKSVRDYSLSWTQGAGGIVAAMDDVAHWSRALYEGPLLKPKQRRELMTIVSNATGKPIATTTLQDAKGFGLGVGQLTMPNLGTFWFYQGETLGYRVLYAWMPKSDAVIVLGLNSQPPEKANHNGNLLKTIYSRLQAAGKL
jgi:D-alanyl-D-alanine carboxypeptidase